MRAKAGEAGLASRLKQARENLGWTQARLAQEAEVSLVMVQKIEGGDRFGGKDTHRKLAGALGIPAAILVYGEDITAQLNSSGEDGLQPDSREHDSKNHLLGLIESDPILSAKTKRIIKNIVEEDYSEVGSTKKATGLKRSAKSS